MEIKILNMNDIRLEGEGEEFNRDGLWYQSATKSPCFFVENNNQEYIINLL